MLLDKISDIDESIFDNNPLKSLCKTTDLITIIRCLMLGICLLYLTKKVFSLYMDEENEIIHIYFFKAIIIFIISINSYSICKEVIKINNMLTQIVESYLENQVNDKISYHFLEDNVDNLEDFFKKVNKFGINGIKDFVICSYIIFMIFLLSIRYSLIIFCIIISPYIVIISIIPQGKIIYEMWKKTFFYSISFQIINKFLIVIPVASKKEELAPIILIGTVFLMYKIGSKICKE